MAKISENDVIETIQKALNISDGNLTVDTTVDDIEEWDSLGHLSILSELDELFGGKIAPINEMAEADSIGKILNILRNSSLIN